MGSLHYPRGVTSALWWLNATNNPAYPAATATPEPPSGLRALPGNHQVVLLWNGTALATGYNVKRAPVMGGPYTPITNSITGASWVDARLLNGVTYYYVVTASNQIGEGLPSAEVAATPSGTVPSTGTNIAATLTGPNITLSWPSNYAGWILQTNVLDLRNSLDWGDVPGSQTNYRMSFPASDSTRPAEFFRLRHPQPGQ